MNAQQLLEAYISSPGREGDKHWEPLSKVIRALVHKAVGKREVNDLEDFEEECILAIWTKISVLKAEGNTNNIENIEAFVRQAVHNRYCDAIRRKRPRWYNLKLELLEIFSGKANIEGFAIWQNPESSARMCGFSEWKGSTLSASGKCRQIIENPEAFKRKVLDNRDPKELPIYELSAAILDYCGGPVEIDVLTNCIAELVQAKTQEPLSLDAQPDSDDDTSSPADWLVSSDTNVEEQVVASSWFEHVIDWFWKEFKQLSPKQRKAVLYGLGQDQVMALVSTVGMKEVAHALEISVEELASLIDRLPIPDAETAKELQIEPRAVPSVRFKAWGRIRRRTRKSSLLTGDDD